MRVTCASPGEGSQEPIERHTARRPIGSRVWGQEPMRERLCLKRGSPCSHPAKSDAFASGIELVMPVFRRQRTASQGVDAAPRKPPISGSGIIPFFGHHPEPLLGLGAVPVSVNK
jgi:hypothetical protein